mmetsp:Transcript_9700/g.25089  ORF Transcript_9700/g.25089 Transcript_9700/m.25089 type:complete len:276 (-) Transcript_9700:342-1169(-)
MARRTLSIGPLSWPRSLFDMLPHDRLPRYRLPHDWLSHDWLPHDRLSENDWLGHLLPLPLADDLGLQDPANVRHPEEHHRTDYPHDDRDGADTASCSDRLPHTCQDAQATQAATARIAQRHTCQHAVVLVQKSPVLNATHHAHDDDGEQRTCADNQGTNEEGPCEKLQVSHAHDGIVLLQVLAVTAVRLIGVPIRVRRQSAAARQPPLAQRLLQANPRGRVLPEHQNHVVVLLLVLDDHGNKPLLHTSLLVLFEPAAVLCGRERVQALFLVGSGR